MNRLTQLFTLVVLCTAALFLGCNNNGDDDGGPCGNNFIWTVELQSEAEALSTAASAYGNDPTTENCEAFRSAYQAYLDTAADLDNCVIGTERQDYLDAIAEAQVELDNLQC